MASAWLFDLGADLYAAYTDNSAWRASCAALGGHLIPNARWVLDLGCGPGTTIEALAAVTPGVRWLGGDLAARMLHLARRRLSRHAVPSRLVRLDAAALPLAQASVDGVVGHSFLYLVPNEQATLREAHRVVRPGGRVAFMEPANGYISPAALWRVSHDPRFLLSVPLWRVMSRHERRYSATSLAYALRRAGFVDLRCTPVLGGLGVIASGAHRGDG